MGKNKYRKERTLATSEKVKSLFCFNPELDKTLEESGAKHKKEPCIKPRYKKI